MTPVTDAATAQAVLQAFALRHGRPASVLARAPGRVNLIGEHTDYNDGFVLPLAIDRHTWVAAAPRCDATVSVLALDCGAEEDAFTLDACPSKHPQGGWRHHVRGTLGQLHGALPLPGGLDLVVAGDVPQGAGLSSSASLALALLHAARGAHGAPEVPAARLARLAQAAENDYVGCQCGIMDQLASACGRADHALLIDCRSLAVQPVPLPAQVTVLIAHSRVRRGLVESAYNQRRQQCEEAALALGVAALRDATLPMLDAARRRMSSLAWRRARHVLSENQRVLQAAQALASGDMPLLGRLMAASHASMRDDFEITVPAVDRLAALLQDVAGEQGGARMTGGGFGGCVVALLPATRIDAAREQLARHYRSPEGEPAALFLCRAADGACLAPQLP